MNIQLRTSYQETATVSQGTTTTVTAPKSRRSQEIRFGTYEQRVRVEGWPAGCPDGVRGSTHYEYIARPAAHSESL